jgi:hypothetical protein
MAQEKQGGCMCGAVRFTATDVPDTFGVCHCEMCRRWTGAALLAVEVPQDKVTWRGEEHIGRLQSSSWAERGFCTRCGSGLYFRVTRDSEWSKEIDLMLGLFDDPNGFTMRSEIWIDHKPDGFAFTENDRKVLTRAECVAKFPALDGN